MLLFDPETGKAIIANQNTGKNYAAELSELLRSSLGRGSIADIGERLHIRRCLRQLVRGLGQLAGKVSQICRREDLDRIRIWLLQSFQYGQVGLSVIVENVPKNSGQLVDLNWCRAVSDMDFHRFRVLHSRSGLRFLASFFLIVVVGFL